MRLVDDKLTSMPEDQPKLTAHEMGLRAVEILTNRNLLKCPRCSTAAGWNAEVLGILVTPLPAAATGAPMPLLPCVVLTCRNCAFVSMHNLKSLGVVS
jgi:hypothetical protein